MAAGGDIRINPQGDRCAFAKLRRDGVQCGKLRRRFNIELVDFSLQRRAHFIAGFADAGENDFFRRNAGVQSPLQFAAGNDIGARAFAGEDAQHSEV